jgi:ribosome-associated protein
VQAIADEVEERLRAELGVKGRIEGYNPGEWVLMDFIDLVVHVFTAEKREFFNLERLWGDAPRIEIDQLTGEAKAPKTPRAARPKSAAAKAAAAERARDSDEPAPKKRRTRKAAGSGATGSSGAKGRSTR